MENPVAAKPKPYPSVAANEWVQPIRRGYRMMCCDCGLVHELDFRIRRGYSSDTQAKGKTIARRCGREGGHKVNTLRYVVRISSGQTGRIAQVIDTADNEAIYTFSRLTFPADFTARAQMECDTLNIKAAPIVVRP